VPVARSIFNMLNSPSCLLCRSIVRGWGVTGGSYRSIPTAAAAAAVLASAHIVIRSLLSAVAHQRQRCSCLTVERRTFFMMATAGSQNPSDEGIVLKLVAASVCIADRAGGIVRNVMSAGNLGIVEKVRYAAIR